MSKNRKLKYIIKKILKSLELSESRIILLALLPVVSNDGYVHFKTSIQTTLRKYIQRY